MPYRFNPLPWRFDRVATTTPPPVTSDLSISPYIVDPTADIPPYYATIQNALDAADAAGGGVVYVRPATYTEDLTLYDNVDLYGTPAVSQNQGQSVTIVGTHTPPASGHVGMNSIAFISTTDVFLSAAAGSTHLVFLNCESGVQDGYFLNLPNWTGILEVYDFNPDTAGAPFAVNDGGINNTGGATILMFSAGMGVGTKTMNLSGTVIMEATSTESPVNFQGAANLTLQSHEFNGAVTFSNTTTGNLIHCSFTTGANSAITMNSSNDITISQCVFNSSNANVITGSGSGNLYLFNNTNIDSQQIGGDVITPNLKYEIRGSGTTSGNVTADLITYDLPNVPCTHVIDVRGTAFNASTPAGAAYNLFGGVVTDGVTARVIDDNFDPIIHEDAVLMGAEAEVVVSGNSFIVRVSGVAGLDINWTSNATITQVR